MSINTELYNPNNYNMEQNKIIKDAMAIYQNFYDTVEQDELTFFVEDLLNPSYSENDMKRILKIKLDILKETCNVAQLLYQDNPVRIKQLNNDLILAIKMAKRNSVLKQNKNQKMDSLDSKLAKLNYTNKPSYSVSNDNFIR